jgi:hypothetical protein
MGIYGLRAHITALWNEFLETVRPYEYLKDGDAIMLLSPGLTEKVNDISVRALSMTSAQAAYEARIGYDSHGVAFEYDREPLPEL